MNEQLQQLSVQFGSFGFSDKASDEFMASVDQEERIRKQWWINYCDQCNRSTEAVLFLNETQACRHKRFATKLTICQLSHGRILAAGRPTGDMSSPKSLMFHLKILGRCSVALPFLHEQ
eukprot:766917-Hanusia_phi.AAC.3